MVVWHLKQTGKVKKLEEWKPRDLTKNKKYHCSEVLFSLILCSNEPFLDHIGHFNIYFYSHAMFLCVSYEHFEGKN